MKPLLIIHSNEEFLYQLKKNLSTCYLPNLKLHFRSEMSHELKQDLKQYQALLIDQELIEAIDELPIAKSRVIHMYSGHNKYPIISGQEDNSHLSRAKSISIYSSLSEWQALLNSLSAMDETEFHHFTKQIQKKGQHLNETIVFLELCEHPIHQEAFLKFHEGLNRVRSNVLIYDLTPFGRVLMRSEVIRPFNNPVDYIEVNEKDLFSIDRFSQSLLVRPATKLFFCNLCNFKILSAILAEATTIVLFSGVSIHADFKLNDIARWLSWLNPDAGLFLFNNAGSVLTSQSPFRIITHLEMILENQYDQTLY